MMRFLKIILKNFNVCKTLNINKLIIVKHLLNHNALIYQVSG